MNNAPNKLVNNWLVVYKEEEGYGQHGAPTVSREVSITCCFHRTVKCFESIKS